jgi:hypothetical protein
MQSMGAIYTPLLEATSLLCLKQRDLAREERAAGWIGEHDATRWEQHVYSVTKQRLVL